MQLMVRGKQVDVNDALRSHVAERLSAGVSKYFDRALDAQVQFSREGQHIRTDISVHAGTGIQLQSHATAGDKAAAFDLAADRIEKRLRRHKRRLVDAHHGRKSEPKVEAVAARQLGLAGEPEAEEAAETPLTIAESTMEIHTLTVGDAVMRLELSDEPVLMFRNGGHGGLNVVYRRSDGNIGWIDPQGSGGE